MVRTFGAAAITAALLALLAPPVDAARSLGDTRMFARVPAPGQPEGLAMRDGVAYVGTHTSMVGNAGQDASRIFR